jgi:hypothetical protein
VFESTIVWFGGVYDYMLVLVFSGTSAQAPSEVPPGFAIIINKVSTLYLVSARLQGENSNTSDVLIKCGLGERQDHVIISLESMHPDNSSIILAGI